MASADSTDGAAQFQRLPYEGPLACTTMLRYFSRRAIRGVEHVDLDTGVYSRSIRLHNQVGVLEIKALSTGQLLWRSSLAALIETRGATPRVRSIFGLDQPLRLAYEAFAEDPVVGPLVAAHQGVRVAGTWDPFETGVRTIVGQQVSVAGASTIAARLVQRLGTPLDLEQTSGSGGGLTHLFPTPETLAEADLTAIGMPQARVDALRGFAQAVASGDIQLCAELSLEKLVAAICEVKGLGPWTANYIAMRLGYRDAFPSADLGLRKAVANQSATGETVVPTASDLERYSQRWRPWRSQAAMLLWHHGL